MTDEKPLHRHIGPRWDLTCRDSGAEKGAYTITGHAAVFNQPCDFRYFKEYVAPGAFEGALSIDPLEVASNWQHEDRWLLGHTLNGTLALEEDDVGLHDWTRVAPTSYGADARILIERGDIQQQSFCFTIKREVWDYDEGEDGREEVTVTIMEVGTLYDVTICALGAYPQTDVELAGRSRLDRALRQGRVPGLTLERAQKRGLLVEDPELAHRHLRAERGEAPAAPHEGGQDVARNKAQRQRELDLAKRKGR